MVADLRLGPWRIWYDPPPIPIRTCDWHYQDDNEETRCGDAASAQACLDEIWERIEDDAAPALPPVPEIEALVERLRVVCPDTTEDAVTVCEAAAALQSYAAECARWKAMCEEMAVLLDETKYEPGDHPIVPVKYDQLRKDLEAILAKYQESKGGGGVIPVSGRMPNLHQMCWPESASDVLSCRPLYGSGYHLSNGTHWTAKERTALHLLAEAGADISLAADILGRPETTLAWRCRRDKVELPLGWAKLIRPAYKPRPRWTPLAYPYINFRRAENEMLLLVNEMVSHMLPGREDVCQDIMLAILERGLTPDKVTAREFIRKFHRENYESNGYAMSLDALIPGTDNLRLIDTLTEEDSLWARI